MMNKRNEQGVSDAVVIIGSIVAMLVIGFGIWGFSVWFSGPAGSANIHIDQNSAQNREYWSAKYNADMNQLQTDQSNIAVLKKTVASSSATQQDAQNLQGLQLNCAQDVTTYNTDAANVLGYRFLPAGFPPSVTQAQYCQ